MPRGGLLLMRGIGADVSGRGGGHL